MTAHTQPWRERFQVMGDIAEQAFLDRNPKAVPLGLRRPPWRVGEMPTDAMKCIPDFVTKDAFVEVMGLGRDQTLKMKRYKLDALNKWEEIGPVKLWVWDSSKQRWWSASRWSWYHCFENEGRHGVFNEGTPYLGLHVDHFPIDCEVGT